MRYALMAVFLIAGVSVAALFATDALPNRVVVLRIDFAALAFLLGIVGIGGVAASAVRKRSHTKFERSLEAVRAVADDDRRQFVRRLDHELTNPLTAIRAGLANLRSTDRDDEQQNTLAMINSQVVRASALISDLRKLADLELQSLEMALVDPTRLLHEVVDAIKDGPFGQSRGIVLSLPAAPWPLPQVAGDRDLLFLAIHNVLDNALKFSAEDDKVEIRGYEDDGMVAIEIADTGLGIAEDDLPHVWEELYRGSLTRGTPGSGLGLSLVKSVSQRHSASLSLRSKPGRGTVVTLRFPIAAVAER